MIKQILQVGLVLAGFASTPSWAVFLTVADGATDVGSVDTLLSTETGSLPVSGGGSGEAAETQWVDDVLTALGVDTTVLFFDYKIEDATVLATQTTDVFAISLASMDATAVADYYIIKNATQWALFDNMIEMEWAVVDLASMAADGTGGIAAMNIPNDWEVSHITAFSAVPIPAAIWLFGSGLIGLIGVARRKV